MIEREVNDQYPGGEVEPEKTTPRGYHEAMRWVRWGLQSRLESRQKQADDFYPNALKVCEQYNFPEKMRNEVLLDWYKKLVNEGQIEEAERIREENAIVAERFPMTAREYLAQRAAGEQKKIDKAQQAMAEKEGLKAAELVKPTNQFRQTIKDDDLEKGLSLLGENPDLADLFLQELMGLIEKSKKPNQAYRWSEASNNQAIQRAVFERLFASRREQGRQDLIGEIYHGRDYEIDLIKSEVENILASGVSGKGNLRMAIKMAQIIGGDYENEIGKRCLEMARPWQNSPNRYERAMHDNLKDLIAHIPYL